jgi:hypothetical protein
MYIIIKNKKQITKPLTSKELKHRIRGLKKACDKQRLRQMDLTGFEFKRVA